MFAPRNSSPVQLLTGEEIAAYQVCDIYLLILKCSFFVYGVF